MSTNNKKRKEKEFKERKETIKKKKQKIISQRIKNKDKVIPLQQQPQNEEEPRSLNSEEEDEKMISFITNKTGLSRFMIRVYLEMKNKTIDSSKLSHLVCRNPNIISLNKSEIQLYSEKYRESKLKTSKRKKNDINSSSSSSSNTNNTTILPIVNHIKDEELRKFIISYEGEKLSNDINKREELSNKKDHIIEKDLGLLWKYIAWARTTSNYMIYLYYIGPSINSINEERSISLGKLENYQIIQPSHLVNFHTRYLNDFRSYLLKSSNIKDTDDDNLNPAYDPRFFVYKWQRSSACTDEIKKLIDDHSHLFEVGESYMIQQFRKEQQNKILSNIKLPSNSIDINLNNNQFIITPPSSPSSSSNSPLLLQSSLPPLRMLTEEEIEIDRLKQEQNGFAIDYDEYKKISIDYFPELSKFPINNNIHIDFDRCKKIILNSFIASDNKKPERFKTNPIDIIIALMFSLHMDKLTIKCFSSIREKETLVTKNGEMKPLIDYIFNEPRCIDEIKSSIEEWIWSNFALELCSRDIPQDIKNKLLKKGDNDFNTS